MKRISISIIIVVVLTTGHIQAQEYPLLPKSFSFGVTAGEYGFDSGIGVEVSTPCIKNTSLCLRVKGTVSWLEQYKSIYDKWAKYKSLNVTIVYNTFVFDHSRGYVELGTYLVFPDAKFSQQNSVQGVTGITGVELFVITKANFHMCYYFAGGVGYIRAYADKLETKPRYGNGFVFNNGLRFYF